MQLTVQLRIGVLYQSGKPANSCYTSMPGYLSSKISGLFVIADSDCSGSLHRSIELLNQYIDCPDGYILDGYLCVLNPAAVTLIAVQGSTLPSPDFSLQERLTTGTSAMQAGKVEANGTVASVTTPMPPSITTQNNLGYVDVTIPLGHSSTATTSASVSTLNPS